MAIADDEVLHRLRERLIVCEQKRDRLSGRVADARQQVASLRRDRDRLEDALTRARGSADGLRTDNMALRNELTECRARLAALIEANEQPMRVAAQRGTDRHGSEEPPPIVYLP